MQARPLIFGIAVIALGSGLAGCERIHFEWQGSSDHFRALDANGDGEVDRPEWEDVQGAGFKQSLGFRFADCDSNGRLSWREYFRAVFRSRRCPAPYLYEDVVAVSDVADGAMAASASYDSTLDAEWIGGPLIVRSDERLQVYESPAHGGELLMRLPQPLPPAHGFHSEVDLDGSARQRVAFSSGPLETAPLAATSTVSGRFPRVVCGIENRNDDLRITMADIEVVWRAEGADNRMRVLKALWIDPRATQHLTVWFRAPVDAAECRLLHLRGQEAS